MLSTLVSGNPWTNPAKICPYALFARSQLRSVLLNYAEMHMRRGEWAEAAKVSGIECVGIVKSCPSGEFPVGAKVALMGGLGRTINGSYAQYTRASVSNVALIVTGCRRFLPNGLSP
jgi:NADPH:quinone reductase